MISQLVKEQLKAANPQMSEDQLAAEAKKLGHTETPPYKPALVGLEGKPEIDEYHKGVAETGRKIILTTVKQGSELTREVFRFIQACKGIDFVESTFKLAEVWAIKALRDGQPEGEKPIKSLSDIAKIQGGAGAASYIAVRSRLVKILKDSEELIESLQEWYNFQAKHDAEPQMFVQPDFLDPWGKRYADDKRGWALFTKDARLAEQCSATLESRKKALDRAKGKEAAGATGQNGDQHQQGMVSGTRQRGNLTESTQQCLNAVIRAVHESAEELPQETVNGILSQCAKGLQDALETHRAEIKAKVAATSSRPSQGIANATASGSAESVAAVQDTGEGGAEQSAQGSTEGISSLVRPEWLDQQDWDTANDEERQIMMDDKEAYLEERELMGKGEEQKGAEANEPAQSKIG